MNYYYSLRITPYPNTEAKTTEVREAIGNFMDDISAINWLYGQEYEKNHHFHIVFAIGSELVKRSKLFELFKTKLYTIFSVPDDKKGNPSFSLEPVRKLDEALSYAVKDGNFNSSSEWIELCDDAFSKSHKKKHSLKSSLADISENFMDGIINERQLWILLCQSRSELGLPLSLRWVDEMCLSLRIKKNPQLAVELWEERNIKTN